MAIPDLLIRSSTGTKAGTGSVEQVVTRIRRDNSATLSLPSSLTMVAVCRKYPKKISSDFAGPCPARCPQDASLSFVLPSFKGAFAKLSRSVQSTAKELDAVTYTDATPTVGEIYAKIADAINRVNTLRFLPPDTLIMHPRRWAWFLSALDTTNRPLVVPSGIGQNSSATMNEVTAEGAAGTLLGLPVYLDPNIPTNLGGGTEDIIIVGRFSDALLFESSIRTRVLPDIGSGTLTVRLQVYGYAALAAGRWPKSFATVGGSGLIAPTF